jgi:hypothetical protein
LFVIALIIIGRFYRDGCKRFVGPAALLAENKLPLRFFQKKKNKFGLKKGNSSKNTYSMATRIELTTSHFTGYSFNPPCTIHTNLCPYGIYFLLVLYLSVLKCIRFGTFKQMKMLSTTKLYNFTFNIYYVNFDPT